MSDCPFVELRRVYPPEVEAFRKKLHEIIEHIWERARREADCGLLTPERMRAIESD